MMIIIRRGCGYKSYTDFLYIVVASLSSCDTRGHFPGVTRATTPLTPLGAETSPVLIMYQLIQYARPVSLSAVVGKLANSRVYTVSVSPCIHNTLLQTSLCITIQYPFPNY